MRLISLWMVISCASLSSFAQVPDVLRFPETEIHAQTMPELKITITRFSRVYGVPISFESPLFEWAGDLEVVGQAKGPTPKAHSFFMPVETKAEPDVKSALNKVVDAYNREAGGAQYTVISTALGLAVVPSKVRGKDGSMGSPKVLLSNTISVPTAPRTIEGHMQAISDALEKVTGAHMWLALSETKPNQMSYEAETGTFAWGANAALARDALVDLLSRSATTFQWGAGCLDTYAYGGLQCTLGVQPVQIVNVPVSGEPEFKWLNHDRCLKCSTPSGPVVPAASPKN